MITDSRRSCCPELSHFSASPKSNDPALLLNAQHEHSSVFCPSPPFQHHVAARSVATGIAIPYGSHARMVVQDSYGAKGVEDSQDRTPHRFVGLILPGEIFQ